MKTRDEKIAEKLKDRRDYRSALITRRNQIDMKIANVESQIRQIEKA
jgi:hypothetical protein